MPALLTDLPSVLAIDIGAGTQDILLFDPAAEPENCVKLVLPSQTQVVGRRIREATTQRRAVHLAGPLMGGGASSDAVLAHIAAGLPLTASPSAALTLHNNIDRVRAMGVELADDPPAGADVVVTGDLDLPALAAALAPFGISLPDTIAVAVQDHGFRPGSGNNEVRFEYLQGLLDGGGDLSRAIFATAPAGMTRMSAVQSAVPGAWVMDTGAAAVLGALFDPAVAAAAERTGAILVNFGNMHTFATLVKGRRLFGLFEHHTGGMSTGLAARLVALLQDGTLDVPRFHEQFDGHGAALDPSYREEGPFPFVAVTGPRRAIARPLGYHEAAPHGDMMLAGPWGLVEALRLRD
jgi:uncharacterized protein (DUF1786 family)